MRETRNEYRILAGKTFGKCSSGRSKENVKNQDVLK
jgi:hypothetical protein